MEQDELRENLTASSTWIRGLFMLLFAVIYSVAEIVLAAVSILQFFIKLATGSLNQRLLDLGYGVSTYAYQIYLFLTFNTEDRPYPFNPWPQRPREKPAPESGSDSDSDSNDDEPHLGV